MMAANKEKPSVVDANRAYFVVLGDTRASLDRLVLMALVPMLLLGTLNFGFLNPSRFQGYEGFSYLSAAHMVIISMGAGFLVLSVFKRLIFRFQVFFSAVMAFMAAGWVYSICLLTVTVAAFWRAQAALSVVLFCILIWAAAVLVAGATVVHVWLLRRRLRIGHSEKRTMGNLVAVSGRTRSKIFWTTFALVLVVPNVLTQGQYLVNCICVVGLIFLACVMPSLPVEFAYLAYLKSRNRAYWEKKPPRLTSKQRQRLKVERLRLAKKAGMWALIVVVGIGLFWALAQYLPLWLA